MFAVIGVDGDDDDDYGDGQVVGEKKNAVMTLLTAVNSYNSTLFMSCKDDFYEMRSGLWTW